MSSLRELVEIREQVIRVKNDPKVPMVLVGNKADLKEQRVVSHERAVATAQSWGNKPYFETSAKRRLNVDEVFVDLCRQIMRKMDTESARPNDGRRGQRGQEGQSGRREHGREDDRADGQGRRRRKKRDRDRDGGSRCVIL